MSFTKRRKISSRSISVSDQSLKAAIKKYRRRLFGAGPVSARDRTSIAHAARLSRSTVLEFVHAARPRMSLKTLYALADVAGFEVHVRPKKKRAARKKGSITRKARVARDRAPAHH